MPRDGTSRPCDLRGRVGRPRGVAVPRRGLPRPDSRERPHPLSRARLNRPLAAGLAALTIAVYAPVGRFEFLNYDDNVYVVDNPRVSLGLNGDNAAWSLTAFENGNWHPLTLLSHMLDVQLFGLDAGAHHGMSLALHVLCVLLLFWLLAETTAQAWPSFVVAALFAVHPLNVQTVAWISERKSLLSTAFWILALIAYARDRKTPRALWYAAMLVFAAFALASKPMAVTLPLTMLLFDLWPLRLRPSRRHVAPVAAGAFACGLLTLAAQRAADAIQPSVTFPFSFRLGNAVVSYAWYLMKMIWPSGLAAFYPHPLEGLSATAIVVSAAVVLIISASVVAFGRSSLHLSMGWWWYVGTLLPVVGIIQVGSQARADRYAYVPVIGIFVIAAWCAARLAERGPGPRKTVVVAAVASIIALSMVTRAQLPYWRDSVALFERAIDVVPGNSIAHNNLGMALVQQEQDRGSAPALSEGGRARSGRHRRALESGECPARAGAAGGGGRRVRDGPGAGARRPDHPLQPRHSAPRPRPYRGSRSALEGGREPRPRLRQSEGLAPARRGRLDETSSRRTMKPWRNRTIRRPPGATSSGSSTVPE